jgi:hypothetical protein
MTPEDVERIVGGAVDDLETRIRERDAADDKSDARVFALAWMTNLRGQGWRPTPAKPAPVWEEQIGPPPNPEIAHRGAELARAALRAKDGAL